MRSGRHHGVGGRRPDRPRCAPGPQRERLARGWSGQRPQGPNQVATGLDNVENPSGIFTKYGYLNDGPTPGQYLSGQNPEASKTEPDENTYLNPPASPGDPSAGFSYGTHFLIQGHENASGRAYMTRINLDVPMSDPHRITLLSTPDATGQTNFSRIDGSSFNPFTGQMMWTMEGSGSTTATDGSGGGVIVQSLNWSGTTAPAQTQLESFGRGGFEGVHPDDQGNIWLVEDIGGPNVADPSSPSNSAARQPNSFVYPYRPEGCPAACNLASGTLQALRVTVDGTPITFHPGDPGAADTYGTPILKLHDGNSYKVDWVTLHPAGGSSPFNANALAKTAGATPFKRPENGAFQPGSNWRTFFFSETGDTNADAGDNPNAQPRGA